MNPNVPGNFSGCSCPTCPEPSSRSSSPAGRGSSSEYHAAPIGKVSRCVRTTAVGVIYRREASLATCVRLGSCYLERPSQWLLLLSMTSLSSPRTTTQMEWSRPRSSSPPPVVRAALDRAQHVMPAKPDQAEHAVPVEPGLAEHLTAALKVCSKCYGVRTTKLLVTDSPSFTAACAVLWLYPPSPTNTQQLLARSCGSTIHHPPSPKQHIEARSIAAARPTFGPASESFQDQAKVRLSIFEFSREK